MAPKDIAGVFSVTPTQRGMVLGAGGRRGAQALLSHVICRFTGPLDVTAFRQAWCQAVARHSILRTGFLIQDSVRVFQVIHEKAPLAVDVLEGGGGALEARIAEDLQRGFDVTRPPLMRLAIVRYGPEEADLVWCHHHAILDGWSLTVLLSEVMECYRATREAVQPSLLPAPRFSDLLHWVRRRDGASDAAFWREHLEGFTQPTPVGDDGRRAKGAGFERVQWSAPPSLAGGVQMTARQHHLTPATVLQAAWALTLSHLSGRSDVVFGITRAGRPAGLPECDRAVGPFLVTLPLRVRLNPNRTVGAYLKDLAQIMIALGEHELIEPAVLRSAAAVPMSEPLFETAVVIQNYWTQGTAIAAAAGLALDPSRIRVEGGEGSYPVLLTATPDRELHFQLTYDADRVLPRDVQSIRECLHASLGLLIEPERRLVVGEGFNPDSAAIWRRRPAVGVPGAPPQDPTEQRVAAVWSGLVGRPVGRDEDFLASGGHSVLAIALAERLSQSFGVAVPVAILYDKGNVANLAKWLLTAPARPGVAVSVADTGNLHDPFPLTDLQRAYWIGRGAELTLGGRGSFCSIEAELAAAVDLERLEAAWARLVDRHPMLRAVLTREGEQRVLSEVPLVRVRHWNLTSFSVPARASALHEIRAELRAQVADVHRWPLFAVGVSESGPDSRRLHVAYDPIVCDAGSLAILAGELACLLREPGAPLPQIGISFRDYLLTLGKLRESEAGQRARKYWEERLDTLPAAPELPAGAGANGGVRFTRRRMDVEPARWSRLQALCCDSGITASVLLIAAFATVIAEWARQRHFCLNLTLFNRQPLHPHVERLVGDFTSLTLLEVDLRERASLLEVAQRLQQRLLADLDHRLFDGVAVLRRLSAKKGHTVLMPVVFTSTLGQEAHTGDGTLGELLHGYGETPQVALDCQVSQWRGSLRCWWDCLDAAYPPGVAAALFAAFVRLIDRLTENPLAVRWPIAPLVDPMVLSERERLNATVRSVPEGTLHGLFLSQARRTPDAPAVLAGARMLTYGELATRAEQCARVLSMLKLSARPIAICSRSGVDQAIASLAVLMTGRPFVRIDTAWPISRQEQVLRGGGCELVLRGEGVEGDSASTRAIALGELLSRPVEVGVAEPRTGGDPLAYVMYTSGSTGTPKGAAISHRAAVNTIIDINRRLQAGPADRVLAVSAATFDLSIYDLFGMLACGGAVVVLDSVRADPGLWLRTCQQHGVTLWNSTPALMEMMVEHLDMLRTPVLPPLRAILLSGDWIPTGLPHRMRRFWPQAALIGLGGATEAAIWSVWHEIGQVDPDWPSVPYGAPLANQTMHVLDERLEDRPDWVAGDLYIGGLGLAEGYYQQPAFTAAAFVVRARDGLRLYRTGDLARFRPGAQLEFLGREDGQVKIRGYRIELGEIETVLTRHSGVAAAAAVRAGDSLRAFVVPKSSAVVLDMEEVREHVARALPPYAVPPVMSLIDRIPLTSNGKVDRAALAALPQAATPSEAPACEESLSVQQALAAASSVLELPLPSADDDFFFAGGDSVSAMRWISRLYEKTGVRLELPAVFEARTARAVAALLLEEGVWTERHALFRVVDEQQNPASSMQKRLWFLDQLRPGDPRYIIPGMLELEGRISVPALRAALRDLLVRHEALRTSLEETDAGLVQHVRTAPEDPLPVETLATASEIESSFEEFATLPFDLAGDIPARFRLLELNETHSVLQIAIHHVAIDAWSFGVIARDLSRLYAVHRGSAEPPPPLPLRYRDFAAWERRMMSPERALQLNRWWQRALQGVPPQQLVAPHGRSKEPCVIPVSLGKSQVARLHECARRTGATLFMVLLSVFALSLHQAGAPSTLAIATSVHGRVRSELENLVGCFVNLVLLRIDLSGRPSFVELIRRTREFTLAAFAHQALPFEGILQGVRAAGCTSEPPFAGVFVLQNNPPGNVVLEDLEVVLPDIEMNQSRYPLHLHLTERHGELHGALRCDGTHLGPLQAQALARSFQEVCDRAGAAPNAQLEILHSDSGRVPARAAL